MSFKCERVQQIAMSLENRPGILADLCAHLGDHGIDIRAITAFEAGEMGSVRMVVDKTEKAIGVLEAAGITCVLSECLAIEMPNHPKGFAGIARVLAVAGINIDYIFGSSTKDAATALGIFGVSDIDKALDLVWHPHLRI